MGVGAADHPVEGVHRSAPAASTGSRASHSAERAACLAKDRCPEDSKRGNRRGPGAKGSVSEPTRFERAKGALAIRTANGLIFPDCVDTGLARFPPYLFGREIPKGRMYALAIGVALNVAEPMPASLFARRPAHHLRGRQIQYQRWIEPGLISPPARPGDARRRSCQCQNMSHRQGHDLEAAGMLKV